jgi:hypothetical protein
MFGNCRTPIWGTSTTPIAIWPLRNGLWWDCIDLTASSPPPEIPLAASEGDDAPRSSSPIEYGSADEDEVSSTENSAIV